MKIRMRGNPNDKHRWGVILGGGDGTRLLPLTRALTGDDRPKQFCRLVGEKTLLAQTRHRVAGIVRPERTVFVLTESHAPFYKPELAGVPLWRMVVQPSNRGTLPAILSSLIRIVRLDSQAVVAFFPSDHHYADERTFTTKMMSAFAPAESSSGVILLAASSSAPETEFGWIEPKPKPANGELPEVKCFWEKPSAQVAQTLLDRGCLWNTFVMVGRASVFLELIRSAEPSLYEIFQASLMSHRLDQYPKLLRAIYEQIETMDFSRRVLSGMTQKLSVLNMGDIGWNDLGDPFRVNALLARARNRKPVGQALGPEAVSCIATVG